MSLVRRTKRKHSRVLEYDSTAVPMAVPLGTGRTRVDLLVLEQIYSFTGYSQGY